MRALTPAQRRTARPADVGQVAFGRCGLETGACVSWALTRRRLNLRGWSSASLFAFLEGGVLQVADHLVDGVLLSAATRPRRRSPSHGAFMVALGHGRGYLCDGPHLAR